MGKPKRVAEHLYIETDGQIYLVREGAIFRLPTADEALPFNIERKGAMKLGDRRMLMAKPKIDRHPEEWIGRDEAFEREDVDNIVKQAIYMTLMRCVSEAALVRDGRVLMVKALRGFSAGYWNLPGGFLEYGEDPEMAAIRETREEIGVDIEVDELLGTYVSGFPDKPAYTLGLVYKGRTLSNSFSFKKDEIERADWFPVAEALIRTRNPFAKWGLVDLFIRHRQRLERNHIAKHGIQRKKGNSGAERRTTVFLDRDGVINRNVRGYIKRPDDFQFLPGACEAIAKLTEAGCRIIVVTNQDAVGWGLLSLARLRAIHEKMIDGVNRAGGRVDEIFICRHNVMSACGCRKPKPGMLLEAAADFRLCPRMAWMVGDKVIDIEAGKAFGCRTAFVGDSNRLRRFAKQLEEDPPDIAGPTLESIVPLILRETHLK